MFLFEYCQGALRSKRDDRDGQVRAMSRGRHVVVSVMGARAKYQKNIHAREIDRKKDMHSEYPRKNIPSSEMLTKKNGTARLVPTPTPPPITFLMVRSLLYVGFHLGRG